MVKNLEWFVPLVLFTTTLVCVLNNQPYTAIVTGSCASFVLGLLIGRLAYSSS